MSDTGQPAPAIPVADLYGLFEHAPVAYLVMRENGVIVRANATFAAWTGSKTDSFAGKHLQDFLTVGTRILYETNAAPQLRMNGRFSEVALELRTASGEVLPVFAHATLQAGDDHGPLRLVLSRAFARRRYEQELIEARVLAKASEASTQARLDKERETAELREQFIAVLGHDLRNPISSISAGVFLLKKGVSEGKRTTLLDMMHGSITRMSGLIDNILDFARGRLGAGIPLDLRPDVLLTPVLDQVVSELRLGVPGRRIETDLALPDPIRCDSSRIGQLMSNLLGNALTHGAEATPIRVHADIEDGYLTMWVANGGAPIPEASMDRLFHPFFRGEVRHSLQGLGLGLHISSEIAKAHGGTLSVTSTAEETRFTFRMPLA